MIGRVFTAFTNKLFTMQSPISLISKKTRELRAGQKIIKVFLGHLQYIWAVQVFLLPAICAHSSSLVMVRTSSPLLDVAILLPLLNLLTKSC